MSKVIKIQAYEYAELNEKAKNNFIHEMWDMPFEYEDEDEKGNTIIKYDYFGEWDLEDQIDFCKSNDYLFDEYGKLIFGKPSINSVSNALMDMYDIKNALSDSIKSKPKDSEGTDITIGDCIDDVIKFLEEREE